VIHVVDCEFVGDRTIDHKINGLLQEPL
jgi:hypothetical protein